MDKKVVSLHFNHNGFNKINISTFNLSIMGHGTVLEKSASSLQAATVGSVTTYNCRIIEQGYF